MRYCVVYFGQSKNAQKSGEKISTAGFASFIWTNLVGMWSCRLILSSTDVPWIKHRLCKQILALVIIFSCLPDVCFRCHTSAAGVAHIWQSRLGLKKGRFTAVNEDLHDISHICLMLFLISSAVWIICSNSTRSIHAGRNPTLDTKCQNDSDCKNLRVLNGCCNFTAVFFLLSTSCHIYLLLLSGWAISDVKLGRQRSRCAFERSRRSITIAAQQAEQNTDNSLSACDLDD